MSNANDKMIADIARILDRRDGATTKEYWSDLVIWYTNEQTPALLPIDQS